MNKKLSLFLILISVGLLTALAAGPVFGGGEDGLEKAKRAKEKHVDRLLKAWWAWAWATTRMGKRLWWSTPRSRESLFLKSWMTFRLNR